MELKKAEIVARLNENLNRDEVSSRQGGNGRSLDYVSGYYVIKRLNEVIGIGNWSYDIIRRDKTFEGVIKDKYGTEVHHVSYLTEVALYVQLEEGKPALRFTEVGYGDGSDKTYPGKAHELAAKEAVTDALKRAAKNLGMSMGLALYDKTQEFVSEPVVEETPKTVASSSAARIKALAAVVTAKRIKTLAELKEIMLTTYKVSEAGKLTEEQAKEFAGKLEEMIK